MKNILVIVFTFFYCVNTSANTDSIVVKQLIDTAYNYRETKTDSALYLAYKANKMAVKSDQWQLISESELLLGSIFNYKLVNDSALNYYYSIIRTYDLLKDSIKIKNKSFPKVVSQACNDIAKVHMNTGNDGKAMEYNLMSSDINRAFNLKELECDALLTRSKLLSIKKEFDKAAEVCFEGVKIAQEVENLSREGEFLNNLGAFAYHKQDWQACEKYFYRAYNIQKQIGNVIGGISATNNMGLISLNQKKYKTALKYFIEAEQNAKKYNSLESRVIALHYLIEVYLHLEEKEKTHETFIVFEEALENYYNKLNVEKVNELEVKYNVEKKNKEIQLLEQQKRIQDLEYNEALASKNRIIIVVVFIVAFVALLVLFLFRNYRSKQIIDKQKLEFQKVTTEQKMLRSQMNPHFIYNSLNSIQAFILSDDSYNAEKYLARFAKLMRGILDNSRADYVLLDNEINVLNLYLELEQVRFEKRFSYEVVIDDDLETEFIAIPPMLIQPFIENAILHGFTNMDSGKITISFKEVNNMVLCTVDDNGIGRLAAAKHKKSSKHQSLATQITKERLETLSVQHKVKAGFTITDKTRTETNEPLGTLVEIMIPFNEV